MDGQGTTWRRNIAENFNRLSRVHQRYRRQTTDDRQTDGPSMTYSEHELEFTFAKNHNILLTYLTCDLIGSAGSFVYISADRCVGCFYLFYDFFVGSIWRHVMQSFIIATI